MTPAAAAVSLEGKIVSQAGEPVADAEVLLIDLRLQVESDEQGRFQFDDIPSGSYLLQASAPQAGSGWIRVEVGEQTEVEIRLDPLHRDDEIIVTASGEARSQLELAQPTSVLSGDELSRRLSASLGETLAYEPGVSSTSFGAGSSRPVIRGLGGDRVRMLQGGLDVGDVSSTSPDHSVSVEPTFAERIEVVRGPATLLYGSSAIGGVVNVIDNKIPDVRLSRPVSGFVDLRGSSVDEGTTGAVSLGGGAGAWAWHVEGMRRDTDDYDIPGFAEVEGLEDDGDEHGEEHDEEHGEEHEEENPFGTLPNSDVETTAGSVGVTYFFKNRGFLGISVSGFDTEYGVPGIEHAEGDEHGDEHDDDEHGDEHGDEHDDDDEHGDEHGDEHDDDDEHGDEHADEHGGDVRIDLERRRIDLRGEVLQPFGAFRGFKARVGIVDYEHDELEGEEQFVATTFFNNFWEGRFELVQKERGDLSGSFGLQITRRDLRAVGEEAFIPAADSLTWALFAFEELDRGPWTLQFGGRFETRDTDAEDPGLRDRSFSGVSASFGAVWSPNDRYAISASLARSSKAPNIEELYSNGAHFATSSFEVGSQDLEEETSLGLDLSFRKKEGRLTGALNFYANRFDDFIFPALTGEEDEGLPVVLFSQQDAEFSGAELSAHYDLWNDSDRRRHVDLRFSGDYVRAELTDNGDPLPRIPPLRLGLAFHYHDPLWHAYLEGRWFDSQDRLAANETFTGSYTLINAGLSYRLVRGPLVYDIQLIGRNLTDEEARNHVSFLKDRVPLPGRDLSLSLRLSF